MPAYPYPPDPATPSPMPVRLRRLAGRNLARVLASQPYRTVEPRRVLLIRPDHLGDLLFLGPALHWLRQQRAGLHLTLAIGPWGRAALPALDGSYDDLLEIPFPAFERGERAGLTRRWGLLPHLSREWRGRFDAALILRPDHWWGAMAAALARIPLRLGYNTPETAPWLASALTLPHEHAAASNLRLAAALLEQTIRADPLAQPLHFAIRAEDEAEARSLLAANGVDQARPSVVIHPGAGAAVKLWESAKWGEVARWLAEKGAFVLVTGGPDETALTAEVVHAAGGKAIDLGGRTSFGVLAAVLASAQIVLGPDSGPLHLAVAVGVPTIHLFGPADPVRFGPWGDPARHVILRSHWSCIPCGKLDWSDLPAHGCVREIGASTVLAAAERLLNGL